MSMFRRKKGGEDGDLPQRNGHGDLNHTLDITHPSDFDAGTPRSLPSTAQAAYSDDESPMKPKSGKWDSGPRIRHSAEEFCAAIRVYDWARASRMLDEDPKLCDQNCFLALKGQKTEGNPIHLIVLSNPPLDFLDRVLSSYSSAAHNIDTKGERTALHWACIGNASPAVLESVAFANPNACKHKDLSHGRTPLHYLAMQANEADQIEAVMEADRKAVMIKDNNQKTPVDLAQDSNNPFKMDIIPALQNRRQSAGGLFSGMKKGKGRNFSPGKYRGTSPGKYGDQRGVSPGKYGDRRGTSPGKYNDSSATTGGDAPVRTGRQRPRRGSAKITPSGDHVERPNVPPSRVRSDISYTRQPPQRGRSADGSVDEMFNPPKLRQSRSGGPIGLRSMVGTGLSPTPPSNSGYQAQSNQPFRPARSNSPPLIQDATSSRRTSDQDLQPASSPNLGRLSNTPRNSGQAANPPPNERFANDMGASIRKLRNKLERKKGMLREKNTEIAQFSSQIRQSLRDEEELLSQLKEVKGPSASGSDQSLLEKNEKITRLKQQIEELKLELQKTEIEVEKMSSSASGNSGNMTDANPGRISHVEKKFKEKKDEQGTLRAILEALEDEKSTVKRDIENIESELKSLETIQMLAQGEDFG